MKSQDTKNDVSETEEELISKAQRAVSHCNWVVGECASRWTKKYARGRTDSDFGLMVGLSADQVFQRRRVWDTFTDVRESYPAAKWSHFYVALNWDDAPECLQWAEENEATVAEMKAWRRVNRGEEVADQEEPVGEWGGDPTIAFVPSESTAVRDPDSFGGSGAGQKSLGGGTSTGEVSERLAGVAREAESGDGEYSPFRKDAGSPAPSGESADVAVLDRPTASADQLIRRMCGTIERMNKLLTPSMLAEYKKLSEKARTRFVKAVSELSTKAAGMM